MYRFASEYLKKWKLNPRHKPLIVRGARQVGKTYLVRDFAEKHFENLLEINFEQDPEAAALFASNKPQKIVQLLELQFNTSIISGETLIFLDEIQASPEVFVALRYFYEQLPEQHIIAAGSLLEFAFSEQTFSVPVGRVEYLYLGPLQFEEFLLASGKDKLAGYLENSSIKDYIPDPVHSQFMELFRTFLVTGGMPESVAAYLKNNSWQECESIKHALLTTFQDDFNKYGKQVKHQRLQLLFKKIPLLVGTKFKYVHVDRHEKTVDLAKSVNLLCLAHIAYRVHHSSCSGIPLGATIDSKKFKLLFLDVGLMSTLCGLNLLDYEKAEDVMLVNSGAVCEQYIGQNLLYSQQFYWIPELHYWVREKKNSSAEVDYVLAEGSTIIPIEVKAGKSGSLRSLHLFLREKKSSLGVRFNSDGLSLLDTKTAMPDGLEISYKLLSLPLYMVGQARRLIGQL